MFTGKLFVPRGLSGLSNLIASELKSACQVSNRVDLTGIKSLSKLAKLRIPQSIWVPLVSVENCKTLDQFKTAVASIDYAAIPPMQSVGLRVSQSRDIAQLCPLSELKDIVLAAIPLNLSRNEFSVHLNHKNHLSIQTNVIPPRPWIPTPQELSSDSQPKWWSVSETPSPTNVGELAIKEFRNESSLACLSAALVYSSNLSISLKKKHLGEETLIWDPFVGNGSVVLEIVSFLADSPFLNRTVTIVANVASKETGLLVEKRLGKLAQSLKVDMVSLTTDKQQEIKKAVGRKSRRSAEAIEEVHEDDARMRSFKMHLKNGTDLTIHLAHTPFQEVFPYISGALILTHIPKGYSEMLGIDKRTLSDWTSFGNLMKSNRKFDMYVLAESASFFKYTKLKFSKYIHLVSPNGSAVGSISKWLGI